MTTHNPGMQRLADLQERQLADEMVTIPNQIGAAGPARAVSGVCTLHSLLAAFQE